MPEVDLEALLSNGGRGGGGGGGGGTDSKDSRGSSISGRDSPESPPPPPPVEDAYFPPDSIEVPIGEGVDWTDLNIIYDREDSTKGSTNPKSSSATNPRTRTSSDRFASSSSSSVAAAGKPSAIIGIPGKVQTAAHRSSRRPPQGSRFPKKDVHPDGGGRAWGRPAMALGVEPGSPEVSCFGKVLSSRERERLRQKSLREQQQQQPQPRPEGRDQNKGCWALFLCGGGGGGGGRLRDEVEEGAAFKERKPSPPSTGEKAAASEPPGLGGMRQFASGRG